MDALSGKRRNRRHHALMGWMLAASIPIAWVLSTGPVNAGSDGSTPAQERAVEALIIKTIKEKPELVLEALQTLQKRQENAKQDRVQQTLTSRAGDLYRHPDDAVGGNPDGDVTMVEFFDYRCGYCKKVHPDVKRLVKGDGNIRYVFKEFPILGEQSVFAARAALAARAQGKYEAFSNAMMEARGSLTRRKVLGIARKIGLDETKLLAELRDNKKAINAVIQRNYDLAAALDITGTPGFVIGDQILRGAASYNALKQVVAHVRRTAAKEGKTKVSISDHLPKLIVGAVLLGGIAVIASKVIGPSAEATVTVKVPELSVAAQRGAKIFDENCAQCHGPNGSGSEQGPPLIHDIYNPGHHSDASFFIAAINGVKRHHWNFGDMPAVPDVNKPMVDAVVRYIRELQVANGITYRKHTM